MLLFVLWFFWVIKDLKYMKDIDILNFRKNESYDFFFWYGLVDVVNFFFR